MNPNPNSFSSDESSTLEYKDNKKFMKPLSTYAALVNIMLGTGPFTLPMAFVESGFVFSSVMTVIVFTLSYITCEFLLEALAITNALHRLRSDTENLIVNIEPDHRNPKKHNKDFSLITPFEYVSIGQEVWGKKGTIISGIVIVVYLYGSITIKGTAASSSITNGIAYIATGDINGFSGYAFSPYYIVCLAFFTIVTFLTLKNVQNTKTLQNIIMFARFSTISLMIFTAFALYFIEKGDNAKNGDIKVFEIDQFSLIYGNIIFALCVHHSLPGIMTPSRPEKLNKRSVFLSGMTATVILLLLGLTATMTFGKYTDECGSGNFPCKINVLYNINFLGVPVIGYIVNFYLIFDLAAMPVMSLALRNNLMRVFVKDRIPKDTSIITRWTLLFTGITLIPILTACLTLKDELKFIVMFTGSVAGLALIFILPPLFCIFARKRAEEKGLDFKSSPYYSTIRNDKVNYGVVVLGVICLGISMYYNVLKVGDM